VEILQNFVAFSEYMNFNFLSLNPKRIKLNPMKKVIYNAHPKLIQKGFQKKSKTNQRKNNWKLGQCRLFYQSITI
jgi:hypothetical protein